MSTIITRNSATSGSVPSSLVQGELAINVKDGRLFYGSGSGNIVREFTGSGGGATFPYTGSARITGSLNVIGTTTITGSLNISGSTTQIGNNNLLGQTNLSGSIIISGSVNASANLALGGTLRLDPAQDPGNTNLTASFLFTSASNTAQGYDLYYRQDGNIVKFKWLEGGTSTGLLYGGLVSGSGTTIYVSSGSGIVMTSNASYTEEISPQFTYITWNNYSASATYLTSSQNTYLYVDTAGIVRQQPNYFTETQYQEAICLGRVTHANYTNITGIGSNVQTTYDSDAQQNEFVRAFGPLKINGLTVTGQTGTLRVNIGSGTSYNLGGFYRNNPDHPSNYSSTATVTGSMARAYRSGSGIYLDNNGGAFYTVIDPTKYDDGSGILQNTGTGNYTIQRIFYNPESKRSTVYYGQARYTSLLNALQYLTTDPFEEGEFTAKSLIFVAYLVVKGNTTDLTNDTQNSIVQAGLFRNTTGGSGAAGTITLSLENLSDVLITTPVNNQALIYNSGTWINGYPASASFAISASYAATASLAPLYLPLTGGTISGNVTVLGTASINTLIVNQIGYSSGSNQLGDAANDTQTLYGTVVIPTGSLTVTGSARITGSLGVTGSISISSGNITVSASNPLLAMTVNNNNDTVTLNMNAVDGNPRGGLSTNINTGEVRLFASTGGYFPTFYSNGSERMRIPTTGDVLIGTTTDLARLTVKSSGTTSATTALLVQNANASASLVVLDNGFVGINTGSAQYNLDVNGTARVVTSILVGPSSTQGVVQTGVFRGTYFNDYNNNYTIFQVQSNGNASFYQGLAIGTSSNAVASAQIEIVSTTKGFLPPRTNLTSNISSPAQGLITYLTGSTNEGLYYYNSGSTPGWRQVADTTFVSASLSGSAGYVPVFTGANSVSSSVIFQSGSNVGIGTTTPTNTLDISGSARLTSTGATRFRIDTTNASPNTGFGLSSNNILKWSNAAYIPSGTNLSYVIYNDQTNTNSLFIQGDTNNVIIGSTTDAGYKFDVNGTARIQGNTRITGQLNFGSNNVWIGAAQWSAGLEMYAISSGTENIKLTPAQQVHISSNSLFTANISAILEISSTNKGFLPPRTNLTSNISTPAQGLMTYVTASATEGLYYYNSGSYQGWTRLLNDSGSQILSGSLTTTGNISAGGNINLNGGTLSFNTNYFTISNGGVFNRSGGTIALVTDSNTALTVYPNANNNVVQVNTSLGIGKIPTTKLDVAGTTRISGSFNTAISGTILTVQGSGSAQPIFTVQGSQGELFSITDSLSGSLFSVNDISGLPILEVFSDNTTLIGNYQDPMLITTAKVVQTNSGSFTMYSLPTASYDTAFFEYSIRSGSNARAGTIMAVQLGSAVNFTETTTTDFGNTSAVSFTVIVTGSNMALTGSSTSGTWTIKTIVRGL
jgi:hypothetical protein